MVISIVSQVQAAVQSCVADSGIGSVTGIIRRPCSGFDSESHRAGDDRGAPHERGGRKHSEDARKPATTLTAGREGDEEARTKSKEERTGKKRKREREEERRVREEEKRTGG